MCCIYIFIKLEIINPCSMMRSRYYYTLDMNVLVLDVLHSKSLKPFGRVEIHDIVELSGTIPIDK